jgi:hypothetical protein
VSKKRKPLLKGDRGELGRYVRELADLVGLRDWTIVMKHGEPANDTSGADINVRYGQKVADIRFRTGWETMPADDLRWLVTHELVHCHLWRLDQRLCDVKPVMGDTAYTLYQFAVQEELEHTVDGIARTWARTLPLPVQAKG